VADHVRLAARDGNRQSLAQLQDGGHIARAQTYPAPPVHVIVGFTRWQHHRHRCTADRPIAVGTARSAVHIENRPGASGNIAAEAVVRAPADGHTLLMTGSFNAINATLYENLSFNFIMDIAPVASLSRTAGVMEVNPSFLTLYI
jgi:tripartite-type tricarboxylate transporter receptor subunit TctC